MRRLSWESAGAFLRSHEAELRSLEGLVQHAAWLAPEGETADLVLEAAAALLGSLGVACEAARGVPPLPPAALGVRVLHQCEALLELLAARALGAEGKWGTLAAWEAGKAALRLTALRRAGGGVLLGDLAPSAGAAGPLAAGAERAERTLAALAAFRRGRALSSLPLELCRPRQPLQARPGGRALLAAETLRALRPVVYCLAVRRAGRRAWGPWLTALAMDLGSDALLRGAPLGPPEAAELRRRRALLVYYLLFSPAYEVAAQPGLHAAAAALRRVPLLGALAERCVETLEGTLSQHSYTTAL